MSPRASSRSRRRRSKASKGPTPPDAHPAPRSPDSEPARPLLVDVVMGIDPGLASTGWAVLERDLSTGEIRLLEAGVVKTYPYWVPERRMKTISQRVAEAVSRHPVRVAIVEDFVNQGRQAFFNRSAVQTGKAIGAAVAALGEIPVELIRAMVWRKKLGIKSPRGSTRKERKQVVADFVCKVMDVDPGMSTHVFDACGLALAKLGLEPETKKAPDPEGPRAKAATGD